MLFPTRVPFRIEGEINCFSDKQKLKEFMTTKPSLQKIINGTVSVKEGHK